jgi:hypothetical protein
MDPQLPSLTKWHVGANEFAPVSSPDYRRAEVAPVKSYDMPQLPTADSRYPGAAAAMYDGRIATDYRMHCSANVAPAAQRKTKQWMIDNAEDIIAVSRSRMAERSAYTELVPRISEQTAVVCDTYKCQTSVVNPNGIGQGRPNVVPELFGTFMVEPTLEQRVARKNVGVTTVYEGGRNTPSRLR